MIVHPIGGGTCRPSRLDRRRRIDVTPETPVRKIEKHD
jgi:hypothetical protein